MTRGEQRQDSFVAEFTLERSEGLEDRLSRQALGLWLLGIREGRRVEKARLKAEGKAKDFEFLESFTLVVYTV